MAYAVIDKALVGKESEPPGTPLPKGWKELGAMLNESVEQVHQGQYYTEEEMDAFLDEQY